MELKTVNLKEIIAKYKYPLLILAFGLALMLIPGRTESSREPEADSKIEQILSCTQGVGEAKVLVSESGVVIVCPGADSPKVRLEIIKAISAYTGFGADRITVLKMAD